MIEFLLQGAVNKKKQKGKKLSPWLRLKKQLEKSTWRRKQLVEERTTHKIK